MIVWGARFYLYLLPLVPLLGLVWFVIEHRKRRALHRIADKTTAPRLIAGLRPDLRHIKIVILLLGLLLLDISLARPRWSEKLQIYKGRGIDIVICLDASKSMNAQDIKPSRIERAKSDIKYLLDKLSAHQVGITAFAGDAYVMCPLTTDVDAAKLFLDIINPTDMPRPGTNLDKAIRVSSSLFNAGEKNYKAMILYTDGDNLEGDPMPAVEAARQQGIRIYPVGVGSLEGSTIPETDPVTGNIIYKKDSDQKIVISRLADRLLLLIAKATDGRYFRAEGLYINRLFEELDALKKKELTGGEYVQYEERYQIFLLPAFLLLWLGMALGDRRGRWVPAGTLAFNRLRPWTRKLAAVFTREKISPPLSGLADQEE